jgi:hypothetical protein
MRSAEQERAFTMALHRSDKRVSDRTLIRCGVVIAALALSCAAYAAGAFDGTYAGMARLGAGNNGSICKTFSASINVADSQLTYAHATYALIKTTVAPDGTFSGSAMIKGYRTPTEEVLKGKISGSSLEADASNPSCAFHLSLTKQ